MSVDLTVEPGEKIKYKIELSANTMAFISYLDIFTVRYIYSLLIDKDFCECQNISVKFPSGFLSLPSGDLFIFLVKVNPIYCYFRFTFELFILNSSRTRLITCSNPLRVNC